MSTETTPVTTPVTEQVTVEYSADGHTATILIDRASKLNALTLGLL
jgi:enoyl-CoA hydratase